VGAALVPVCYRFGASIMPEFTPAQVAILERLRSGGFDLVAFPMYANYVGVRKGNCAALLAPENASGLRFFGEPCYLIGGNLTVRLFRRGTLHFVWKKQSLEATADRVAELRQFAGEVSALLLPVA
jgi:hypothetical protein